MTDEPDLPAVPDVTELVDRVKSRVAERRRAGDYPVELTEQLRSHFERVKRQRPTSDLDYLRTQLDALDALGWFSPEKIVLDSKTPGLEKLHAVVAKVVARQTQGILEQVQLFADALRDVLRTVLAALEEPHGHVHDDLLGQVDALHDQVSALIRQVSPSVEPSWLGEFEPERARELAKEFEGSGPVLDIGSGRFRAILDDLGIDADGSGPGSALDRLRATPEKSLGGLAMVDGAARLLASQLREIAALAFGKVRPGGRVLVHRFQLHPAYVRYAFAEAGFAVVRVQPGDRPEDCAVVAVR